MASGISASLICGSEEGFDTCCSPCMNRGISKEAQKYCTDCCVNFCEQCLQIHNTIPLSQGHQIVDKSGHAARSLRTALPTERCEIHNGKLVDMFCADHDTVCCSACIAVKHRTCVNVDYLPDVAKGIKTSQEYRDVNNSLDEMLNNLNKKKTNRLENLASLEKDKTSANEEITRVEEELKKKITEMAQKARTELLAKYDEGRKVIEGDIKNVERVITKVTSGKDKLKEGNDAQLFVNLKGVKMIIKDGQILMSALSTIGKKKCLTFMPNTVLEQLVQKLISLGSICIADEESEEGSAEKLEYTAKLQGKYKVNDSLSSVKSVCILDDTTVLIFDHTQKYLKRLHMADFKVVDQLQMEDYSYSVCRTGSQEVAVALYDKKKIQFVSVAGTMTLTRSFSTDHNCYGMAFNEITAELFVSNNGNQVKVYDKTGNVLKSYVNDYKGGKPLFNSSRSIALSVDQNTLFITDWKNGLIALDKTSSLRWNYSDNELTNAVGVCVLPGNVILVSGCYSDNVIQVDKNGMKLGTLLGAGDNLINPQALAYHRNSFRLIVGQGSNEIVVYKLFPKKSVKRLHQIAVKAVNKIHTLPW